MDKTKIDWADMSWNPVTGCLHGCEYCYARRMAERFGNRYLPYGDEINVLDKPMDGEKDIDPYPFGFEPTFHRYRLGEPARKTRPRNIFVCSMADLFGEWVPDSWIQEVFAACEAAPQHRYMFLTKYPKRLCVLANSERLPQHNNWWYGTSITKATDRRFPGRISDHTFLSIEPLLEPLDAGLGSFGGAEWIIVGAETGKRKDKVVPKREWVENIVEAAGITKAAVFMKSNLRDVWGDDLIQEYPW